jgi:hypothetical protein
MPYTPGLAALNIRPPQPLDIGTALGLARLANGGRGLQGGLGGLGGGFGGPEPGAGGLSRLDFTPPPGTGASDLERYRLALGMTESSGNYGAIGPRTRYGPAYGRYQVLETNVGPWTERWFGRRLTPEEFRNSPEAQDAVFRGQFGMYLSRGGPRDAVSRWFTGQPYSVGRFRSDRIPGVYRGLTGEEYVARVESLLQGLR